MPQSKTAVADGNDLVPPLATSAVRPHRLSEAASLLLDIIRFSAAIVVVIDHLTLPELHTGLPDLEILGNLAVPVFFVLSGFVIRFVTRAREHTQADFFIDRASRIYSVVLPAMVLTLIATALMVKLAPAYYAAYLAPVSDRPISRILLNLTFLSQSWGHNTIPFANIPFWSLSYECLFYVAYGLTFYMRGKKRLVAVLLWAVIAGPEVIFLLPVWWLGCWVYDLYYALRGKPYIRWLRWATVAYAILGIAFFAAGSHTPLAAPLRLDLAFGTLPHPLQWLHLPLHRASMLALGSGVLAGIYMLLALFVSDLVTLPEKTVWGKRIRFAANGTFTIYLMHFPLLVLASGLHLLRGQSAALNIGVAVVICILLILAAVPVDHLKNQMRLHLRRVFLARAGTIRRISSA